MCLLSDDIKDYHFVSQGKITIPSMDDSEEFGFTNVSNCWDTKSSHPICTSLNDPVEVNGTLQSLHHHPIYNLLLTQYPFNFTPTT